jgi:hypothetical protein
VFVIVEGTKAGIVPARVAQLDSRLGDKVYDIDFGFDLIYDRHVVGIIDSIEGKRKSMCRTSLWNHKGANEPVHIHIDGQTVYDVRIGWVLLTFDLFTALASLEGRCSS